MRTPLIFVSIDRMAYKCRLALSAPVLLLFYFGVNRMKTISNCTHLNQINLRMTSKKIKFAQNFLFLWQFYRVAI